MHYRAAATTYPTTGYPLTRYHEPFHCYSTTIYRQNASAAQTLEGLHNEVRKLRDTEHCLQQQIHRYQSFLDEVQAKLYAKINRANEMQNFLAPVSRLPNEMLLAVFEEAVASQDPGVDQRAEFTISKVSRRWRELAIHSPRLWRRVCVTPGVIPSMLELYKSRGSRTLDVEIFGWKDRRDFQRFEAALETMLDPSTSGRWRSLSIAGLCDTHLSHLTLKLAHVGHFSGLKHFKFRALRPGQTCSVSFLMETATATQLHSSSQALSPCGLKSLDAENFMLTGDVGSIHARAIQSFARLSSLTLRRYSNDARSFRIMIDFSAFGAMLGAISNLTTLVLHGQPLRFRTDPFTGSQSQGTHERSISSATTVHLPHLQTLVLHPGVLKPRYLQHTISAINAPALRHFELVFPDSKMSGQNIVERLFVDAGPSSSVTEQSTKRKRPRFPCVETLILHNASNAGTALAFIHAFPNTMHATLGGVDVGFFPLVLRACAGSCLNMGTAQAATACVGVGPTEITGLGSRSGGIWARSASGSDRATWDCTCARFAYWNRLRTLTLRHPRQETLRVLHDWIRNEYERGHAIPMLIIEGALDRSDIRSFAQCARLYTRVDLMAVQSVG